jgi:ABC-2 type transport system ATP-binding protein
MEPGAAAIECRGLTKRYGQIVAIDRLDLTVPAGSVFGFLGPNGAGKTTTLRILTSLARASSGEATVAGVAVGEGAPNRRALIGYLDQDPRFHGWMTGREVLELVGRLFGLRGQPLRAATDQALERVGLADAARRAVGGYSGGMRQRLGLAQAILNSPPVLLLDEPVSALDPEGRRDVLEIVHGLGGSSTVLFSTHILNDVERICDRVAIIDHGRLVTEGQMDQLLARYASPMYVIEPASAAEGVLARLAELVGQVAGVTAVDTQHGTLRVAVADDEMVARRLLAALAGADVALLTFERQRPTLEDVFLQLVGHPQHGEAA